MPVVATRTQLPRQPDRPGRAADRSRADSDVLWLAVVPTVCLVVAAIVWVAPPLARLAYPAPSWKPYPSAVELGLVRPEPVEQTRYLLACAAPFLLLSLWLSLRRWYGPRQSTRVPRWYPLFVQLLIGAVLVACWASQKRSHHWFGDTTLAVAFGLAIALVVLARKGWLFPKRQDADLRRRPLRLLAGAGAALVLTAVWLSPAVYRTPNAVTVAQSGQLRQIEFLQDELVSVLNGRTPMVDFASQYSKLLPFVLAPVISAFGPSIGVTTGLLALLGLVGLMAVYGIFLELTRDAVEALVLYLPFLAFTLFTYLTAGDERINLATLFGVVPIRVLGPFLLGWLCARHVRKGGETAPVLLFVGAALAAVNNTEFGAASFAALGLALWCGHSGGTAGWPRARSLVVYALIGGATAVAGVCFLTLVRTGSLPDLVYVSNLTRVFAIEGFGMEPIRPTLGLHLIIYLTFVGALVWGIASAVTSSDVTSEARVLRALLAYTGLLGLGAGAYFAGRSHPTALFGMFPTWGLAMAVMCWAALRAVATSPKLSTEKALRWTLPVTGAVVGFGLMMTAVVQIPSPAGQLRRMSADGLEVPQYRERAQFIAAGTSRGERVAILAPVSHLLAEDTGVVNVSPYADETSIAFYEQMDLLMQEMRSDSVRTVFVAPTWPETSAYLVQNGYVRVSNDVASGLTLFRRLSL